MLSRVSEWSESGDDITKAVHRRDAEGAEKKLFTAKAQRAQREIIIKSILHVAL
jgi:hypothetical protein